MNLRPSTVLLGLALGASLWAGCTGTAAQMEAEAPVGPTGGATDTAVDSGSPRDVDAGFVDAGGMDAGLADAGAVDTGGMDAGLADAGGMDAGLADAGGMDAGGMDAGAVDAGAVDAGAVDAGTVDAGIPPGCLPLRGTITALAKGTYCVTGDVIVPTGTTLDIPAGTTFIFMGRHHFGRDPSIPDAEPPAIPGSGSIHAIGTAAEPIVFRGATPNTGWFGIVVSHSHDTVHLEYVTIRDTYKDDQNPSSRIWRRGGGLGSYVNAKGTIVRHCTFINNRASSVAGALDVNSHGQWPNPGPVEITDSRFEDNSCECAVYSFSSTDLCGGGAIRVSHIGGDAALVKLRDNVFRHNESIRTSTIEAYGGAIGGFDSSVIIGPGNVFDGNRATSGDGAISCSHQPRLGTIISAVDVSTVFTNNSPDNGCGE